MNEIAFVIYILTNNYRIVEKVKTFQSSLMDSRFQLLEKFHFNKIKGRTI